MAAMRAVQLPEELCAAVEKRFAHKFPTLEELLSFVLQNLLQDNAGQADIAEQKLVEERLRELGYL